MNRARRLGVGLLRAGADLESLRRTIWGVNFGTATPPVKLAGIPLPVLLTRSGRGASETGQAIAAC
jgi:hypothetical protein